MLAERLTSQLLCGPPARDPLEVAERLLAIQGQDGRGARLAIRSRSGGLTAADVDRALTEDRSLLITTLNRGTLHLIRSEDYGLLQAVTTPAVVNPNAKRLNDEGVSPRQADKAMTVIERVLAAEGPQTRAQLRDVLDAAKVPTAGQAMPHLMMLASLRGLIVRGPMAGSDHAFVLVRDWLGEQPHVDRDAVLGEFARRYLAGHGPASDRDLARWAGLPLRDARAGLGAISGRLVQRDDGLVDLRRRSKPEPLPPPRLLGSFDPVLHGWVSRGDILGGHAARTVTTNGIFRPFAMVAGRAVGIWTMPRKEVELELFVPLGKKDRVALDADALDVKRFLGV